jgi:uncharacterized membrane protein YgcG
MNNLYETLEICLQELEQGADIETVLSRYPDLADELRPILETSVNARKMAVSVPSAEVVQRNRAKVLQHAAQLREAKASPSRRIWFASMRRLAVTLAVLAVLFASGTGLVRAASTTLPGDNLYPIKRTWEDVLLVFTFNVQQRDALEIEHENERLHELQEVFAEGRSAEVDFAGSVTSQNGNQWTVSDISVVVSAQTEIRGGTVIVGSAVRVKGRTQGNNLVSAERIELLPAGAKLPDAVDEPEVETENREGQNQQDEDNSGKGSGEDSSTIEETKTPEPVFERKDESLTGTVNSMDSHVWDVSGIPMDVSSAEIKGTPSVGASVTVEGYYDANGVFIATKIEFESSGSGNDNSSSSQDDSNNNESNSSGSNDNSGSNSKDSHDDSSHNGTDDSGGGGSNSGSGGGGGD